MNRTTRFMGIALCLISALVSCKKNEAEVPLTVSVSPDKLEFASENTSGKTVKVTTNTDWQASCNSDWITVTPNAGKTGETTVTIAVTDNLGVEGDYSKARTGEVVFSIKDKQVKLTVNQLGEDIVIVASSDPEDLSFTYEGGTFEVQMLTNSPKYDVISSQNWLTFVEKNTRTLGTQEYTCTVAASEDAADRTATLTFRIKGDDGQTVDESVLTVKQAGKPQPKDLPGKETALSGEFQVNPWGKTVKFSTGALYWDGIEYAFEENQTAGVVGTDGEIEYNPKHVDHLFWTSTPEYAYAEEYQSDGQAPETAPFFADNLSADWCTLDGNEWNYIITHYIWNANVTIDGKYEGMVISPKGLEDNIPGKYTADEWKNAEKAGYVFIPSFGFRTGKSISNRGNYTSIWTNDFSYVSEKDGAQYKTASFSCNNKYIKYPTGCTVNSNPASSGCYVRLVTVTKDATPATVNGEFTVSADGKKVKFAKGNLCWDGLSFNMEASQTAFPTEWDPSHVGHFYWTSNSYRSYQKEYSAPQEGTEYDKEVFFANQKEVWGADWRILTKDEWVYLFTNSKNKTLATIDGVKCMIIACDSYADDLASSYTAEEWAAAEEKGVAALPIACYRTADGVATGVSGYYWSSTYYGLYMDKPASFNIKKLYYSQYYAPFDSKAYCDWGTALSVRMVTEVK